MITITAVCLCLITHVVYGTTTITVNNNCSHSDNNCEGNSSCTSLPCALKKLQNNTVINITSKVVTLNDIVGMGSGNLSNITITGNGTTIMCNNTGGVYCESCSNITIMGITWYQCGRYDSMHPTTQTPALNFTTVSNMTIHNCTFQSSTGCPVYINNAKEIITIADSHFVDNYFGISRSALNCAGIYVKSGISVLNISIVSSKFYRNGCKLSDLSSLCHHYGVIVTIGRSCELVNVVINSTEFSNNSRGLFFNSGYTKSAVIQLAHINVYNNTANGIVISASPYGNSTINIDVSFATLMNNVNPLSILTPSNGEEHEVTITISINNSVFNNNIANDTTDPLYQGTTKLGVLGIALKSTTTTLSIAIINSHFYNNFNGALGINLDSPVTKSECESISAWITFTNVTIYNTSTTKFNDNYVMYAGVASVSVAVSNVLQVTIKFTNVNFTFNNYYSSTNREVLLIQSNQVCSNDIISNIININLTNCIFDSNIAFDHVMFLDIQINSNNPYAFGYLVNLNLFKCDIDNNYGGESIVYIHGPSSSFINSMVTLTNSAFSNNKGTALYMHSIITTLIFAQTVLFINNTANSGAGIYFEEVRSISSDNADVHFVNNSAEQKGGALYFNLVTDNCNVFQNPFNASFINNSAKLAGNSIYFSIPQSCQINTNISDESSLLYVPNKFNYSQPIRTKSPPIVTSPYNIKLYPPAIAVHNDYVIHQYKMLGEPIQFNASVFDYFDNITEPVIFIISCITCGDDYVLSTYQIIVHDQNFNELKVFPILSNDVINNANIFITMVAVLSPIYKSISASLSIQLSSCHAGYLFEKLQAQCICYPHSDIVHCIGDHSEIKKGYWIGFLTEQHYTSSICPSTYCNFAKRTETNPGYYDLPTKSDDQCSSNRTGVACGECKPGYTLAYDSPDCIHRDKCSAGMTVLVIVLTILYWIAVVAGLFCLMYFWFKIPLGFVYVIIYYYSIVDIMLVDDLSNIISQLVNILSSFAKLTPPLFGQLCLVEGLSGIDQQFIHYFHVLAVSLILLIIVVAARYSGRLARFISPCIIRVICLLLLLSYTSLASTSLQLLRPLTFNDVDEVRTYSSPDIKYFTHRHLAYAIVAILCEVIVVIGLPLLLLLEPILSQRINFVRIKPLLDEFQDCYKGKHRWFAAYYLICRQVMFLIVYVGNGNYYNMLYGLQTACIIIAMIHGWVQPYKNNLLNGLDEVILLILVLVVNVSTFSILSSIALQISTVLLLLPLLLLSLVAIKKLISRCFKKKRVLCLFNPAEAYGDSEEDNEDNLR